MKDIIQKIFQDVEQKKLSSKEALTRIEQLKIGETSSHSLLPVKDVFVENFKFDETFLKDHTIFGQQVLLGVTHCSLAIETARILFPRNKYIRINKLLFTTPLIFHAGESANIACRVDKPNDRFCFINTYRKNNSGHFVNAARGEFSIDPGDPPPVIDITGFNDNRNNVCRFSGDEIYERLRSTSIVHGPSLQIIRHVSVKNGQSLGVLHLTDEMRPYFSHYQVHPALIDGAIVSGMSALGRESEVPFVPFFIKAVSVYDRLPESCLVRSKMVKVNSNIAVADIAICDRDGRPLLCMDGFTCKKVNSMESFMRDGGSGRALPPNKTILNQTVSNHTPLVNSGAPLLQKLEAYLENKLNAILERLGGKLDRQINFMDLGIDSNRLIDFAREMERDFDIELYPTLFFEYQNISELVNYLNETCPDRIAAYFQSAAPQAAGLSDTIPKTEVTKDSKTASVKRSEPSNIGSQKTTSAVRHHKDDIAIIGMAGKYARSANLDAFWHHLAEKTDLISEVPEDHFDYRPFYQPDAMYCKWGSFIDDIGRFDAGFFQFSSLESECMDPQLRHLLQVLYHTAEDAGYGGAIRGTNTGMFVGVCFSDYGDEALKAGISTPYIGTGNATTMMANRPSYYFDLKGPSVSVNTACSSSLVALHMACRALRNNECEMAFAAGTNLILSPQHYLFFCSIGALSRSGRCYTFDRKADGYIPAEGVSALLLKPLAKSIADKDVIHGVIRGSAVNHGGHTQSITAPSAGREAQAIKDAWRDAGIDPETITFIEMHGIGTKLGDPVEADGLKLAFKDVTSKQHFCALGSAKAHIGHAEGAAGITGVIKVLLSMKYQKIPAMPGFSELNPYIKLDRSPFFINRELMAWEPEPGVPRCAGVSSFGFGGTFAHMILEEYSNRSEPVENVAACSRPAIILLSAKTKDGLKTRAEQLLAHISQKRISDEDLTDVAYTLQVGREPMPERLALMVTSVAALEEKLNAFLENRDTIADLFHGSVEQNEALTTDSVADGTQKDTVDKWIAEGRYDKLLDFWVRGLPVDWNGLYPQNKPRRLSLPGYPFKGNRYWIQSLGQNTGRNTFDEVPDRPVSRKTESDIKRPDCVNTCSEDAFLAKNKPLPVKVSSKVKQMVSEILQVNSRNIDSDTELNEYGFDSIAFTGLASLLSRAYNIDVKAIQLFEHPSINAISRYLVDTYPAIFPRLNSGRPRDAAEALENDSPVWTNGSQSHYHPQMAEKSSCPSKGYDCDDIAIIGLDGRYPMANDLETFWANLTQGKSAITEMPQDRMTNGNSGTRWGGFIDDVDQFDPLFFNISPGEAAMLDPQVRLFMETVWHTLEDAGYTAQDLAQCHETHGERVGVFVGCMYQQYPWIAKDPYIGGILSNMSYWSLANRISYALNFKGPSIAVDTACSSSLMAVHMACESIKRNECTLAIAGGVNLNLHPSKFQALDQMMMLEKGKLSRPLGQGSGYLPGEGVGALLLKPVSKAVADGDHIYGLIKGSAINHVGRSAGFTTPSAKEHEALVVSAIKNTGLDPETIGWIEVAANGSPLGDAIEMSGLINAFKRFTNKPQFCGIGSVKSNIGHLEAASGISQITKVLLQMRYQKRVPSINAEPLNPDIELNGSAFKLQTELSEWDQMLTGSGDRMEKTPRRAGVSSLGAGGSNVFLVLEEYENPTPSPRADSQRPYLFVFSARNSDRLITYIKKIADFVERNESLCLADVAYTLQVGRQALKTRLAIVAYDRDDLLNKCKAVAAGSPAIGIDGVYEGPGQLGDSELESITSDYVGDKVIAAVLEQGDWDRMAMLWCKGFKVDWQKYHKGKPLSRISLPTYPFERRRCWLNDVDQETGMTTNDGIDAFGTDIQAFLAQRVARLLGLMPNEIDCSALLDDYGMDSIRTAGLKIMLENELGIKIPTAFLGENRTIASMSNSLNHNDLYGSIKTAICGRIDLAENKNQDLKQNDEVEPSVLNLILEYFSRDASDNEVVMLLNELKKNQYI